MFKDLYDNAQIEYKNEQHKKALELFKKALCHKEFHDQPLAIKANVYHKNGLCNLHMIKEDKDLEKRLTLLTVALNTFQGERNLYQKTHDSTTKLDELIASLLKHKAWLYYEQKKIPEMKKNYEEAFAIIVSLKYGEEHQLYQELKDLERTLYSLQGDTANDNKEFDQAILYYKKAIRILESFIEISTKNKQKSDRYYGDLYLLADHQHNIAECKLSKGDKAGAILFFMLAKSRYESLLKEDPRQEKQLAYQKSLSVVENLLSKLDPNDPPIKDSKQPQSPPNPIKRRIAMKGGVFLKTPHPIAQKNQSSKRKIEHEAKPPALIPRTEEELNLMEIEELKTLLSRLKQIETDKATKLSALHPEPRSERMEISLSFSS